MGSKISWVFSKSPIIIQFPDYHFTCFTLFVATEKCFVRDMACLQSFGEAITTKNMQEQKTVILSLWTENTSNSILNGNVTLLCIYLRSRRSRDKFRVIWIQSKRTDQTQLHDVYNATGPTMSEAGLTEAADKRQIKHENECMCASSEERDLRARIHFPLPASWPVSH